MVGTTTMPDRTPGTCRGALGTGTLAVAFAPATPAVPAPPAAAAAGVTGSVAEPMMALRLAAVDAGRSVDE